MSGYLEEKLSGVKCSCACHNQQQGCSNCCINRLTERIEFVERALDNYREYKTGIEDLETHVMYLNERLEKLEGYMQMEDRVTASDVLNRLTLLEDAYKADFETAKDLIFHGAETHASILRCESKIKEIEKNIEFQMEVFKANFAAITSIQSKKPYCCPVCGGSGKVENFEQYKLQDGSCLACEGKGIVWG